MYNMYIWIQLLTLLFDSSYLVQGQTYIWGNEVSGEFSTLPKQIRIEGNFLIHIHDNTW